MTVSIVTGPDGAHATPELSDGDFPVGHDVSESSPPRKAALWDSRPWSTTELGPERDSEISPWGEERKVSTGRRALDSLQDQRFRAGNPSPEGTAASTWRRLPPGEARCHTKSPSCSGGQGTECGRGRVSSPVEPGASPALPGARPAHAVRKDILQAFHQQGLPDSRGPQQETHPRSSGVRELRCREARLRRALIG
ncbi:hypothetical protein LEMLEM_LOCUS27890 [Lemmus lemmus]